MDAREEAASILKQAQATGMIEGDWTSLVVLAVKRHLDAIDEDLQKLRKELRTRNGGGENA